jgi:hypothetical protein
MRNYFLILFLLFASLTANSQNTEPNQQNQFQKPKWLECGDTNDPNQDEIEKRILFEYDAVYLSKAFDQHSEAIKIPCLFKNQDEIDSYTAGFKTINNKFDFGDFYLQPLAKASLERVFQRVNGGYDSVARNCNVDKDRKFSSTKRHRLIRERCTKKTASVSLINNDWALRSYKQTQDNWMLAEPFDFLVAVKPPKKGKPKMFSYAIPGGSQHHLGLAIDVNNGTNTYGATKKCDIGCEEALRENYWYRTVRFDKFHFTFLGVNENELRSRGLKPVTCSDTYTYWVPNVSSNIYSGYENWRCE